MQTLLPRVFMRRARDTDPLVLRDAFMLLVTRPESSTGTDGWQEIAPGVQVQRAGLRWLLRHDEIEYRERARRHRCLTRC